MQASKYVLKHQEQDSEGEVKTELYKAEILPTRMGGASVKFTDVEKLHHNSPKTTRRVTRSMTRRTLSTSSSAISDSSSMEEWTDVETRVSGIGFSICMKYMYMRGLGVQLIHHWLICQQGCHKVVTWLLQPSHNLVDGLTSDGD